MPKGKAWPLYLISLADFLEFLVGQIFILSSVLVRMPLQGHFPIRLLHLIFAGTTRNACETTLGGTHEWMNGK